MGYSINYTGTLASEANDADVALELTIL
ncbi:hypothetical protein THOD04_30423 [Vibrio owensii]|nr:hypothetical protein THOD04_30423 [Vibrio owensii]